MESSALTAVVLPVALGVVMLGLGLSLSLADFTRVAKYPRAVVVGLFAQMLALPALCYLMVKALALPAELAVGMMLLAASPGGATANLYSHLAKGDVALNITLTAVNSLLSVVTLPLIVNLSLGALLGADGTLPLQFAKTMQIFALVLGPVAIGMALRRKLPSLADRLGKPVKILSALFLVLVILGTVAKERANLLPFFQQVGLAALLFNLASMAVGYGLPRLARLERKQSIAIGMEIGIHNGTLAIAVASSPHLLNNGTMAIPAAVYSVIMFFTAALFGVAINRLGGAAKAAEPGAPVVAGAPDAGA